MTGTPWVQMLGGRAVDLLDPCPASFTLAGIARGLAAEPRFRGQTRFTWSVASHSLLVEKLMPPETGPIGRLQALLHDAHEAVLGDISTPVKLALQRIVPFDPVGILADRLQVSIHIAAGLGPMLLPDGHPVVAADLLALAIEKRDLLEDCERRWDLELPDTSAVTRRIIPETEQDACQRFVGRFCRLATAAGVLPWVTFLNLDL